MKTLTATITVKLSALSEASIGAIVVATVGNRATLESVVTGVCADFWVEAGGRVVVAIVTVAVKIVVEGCIIVVLLAIVVAEGCIIVVLLAIVVRVVIVVVIVVIFLVVLAILVAVVVAEGCIIAVLLAIVVRVVIVVVIVVIFLVVLAILVAVAVHWTPNISFGAPPIKEVI